jgi:hypothetical protein
MEQIYEEKNFRKNSHAFPPLNDTLTNLSNNPTGARKTETSVLAQGDGKKRRYYSCQHIIHCTVYAELYHTVHTPYIFRTPT